MTSTTRAIGRLDGPGRRFDPPRQPGLAQFRRVVVDGRKPHGLAREGPPQMRRHALGFELRVGEHVVVGQHELEERVPVVRAPEVLPGLVHPQGPAVHREQLHAERRLLERVWNRCSVWTLGAGESGVVTRAFFLLPRKLEGRGVSLLAARVSSTMASTDGGAKILPSKKALEAGQSVGCLALRPPLVGRREGGRFPVS